MRLRRASVLAVGVMNLEDLIIIKRNSDKEATATATATRAIMTLEDYLINHEPMPLVMVHGSSDQGVVRNKRVCSDEKVERKHKRMIKNRESAARSRARRKSSSPCVPTPPQEMKYQLRRTSSASF
ncbi:hypothetical protein Scep_003106 [Stephania cephalantha]|uniref:BZIP domain-containing protein n=1 Tax=Stephania cephalantha TaxID=152367 RepID=A0AAP0PU44_9MAGN